MGYSRLINLSKHNLDANSNLKDHARELRRNQTYPEKILWDYIRARKIEGRHFRRQHPYGIYVLDFYCFEANLAIEIDGKIHLSHQKYDVERTKFLESSGLKIIRFKNSDVENRIEWVLEKIKEVLNNSASIS
jgi:very-short-patch-repair endonuclease